LKLYPNKSYGFDINRYIYLCDRFGQEADSYRRNKTTIEFNFITGRTRQRALLDAFKDILSNSENNSINPIIRIDEFEVGDILDDYSNNIDVSLKQIKKILIEHFELANMSEQIKLLKNIKSTLGNDK
jgi:hypothetical protein